MASSGQRELTAREKKEIKERLSWDLDWMEMPKRERKARVAEQEKIQARRPAPVDQNENVHPRRWSSISRVPKWLHDILDLKPLDDVMHGWTEPPYITESWCIRHVRSKKSYVSTGVHVFEVTLPSEQEKNWSFDLGFILKEIRQFLVRFSSKLEKELESFF